MIHTKSLVASVLFSAAAFNANATLTTYSSGGIDLVYSSVSDITWTADGNLLGSMMESQGFDTVVNAILAASPVIHDTPNQYDGSYYDHWHYDGNYTLSAEDFNYGFLGQTNWFGAMGFVNYLNSINYAGSNQWSLPSAGDNPTWGFDITDSQWGQLYYTELGLTRLATENDVNGGIFGNGQLDGSSETNIEPFSDIQINFYWMATEDVARAYQFDPAHGFQWIDDKPFSGYAWAVTPGQISSVPVPAAVWLFSTSLFGLMAASRRKR
ncbi:VPLPA-CTERM sorting domain-containing protein [Methylomonas rhizoryzae]|uniref:VPLPA-CTERM sorting domain-containing protein n=1 Tax=Methylomonas rhizoryzae TaxID=2608981 RepID=UPI0012327F62|nr:VPLPA-CTERM sorting domain-containing protein [Methylomonas rhizoryzae]